MKDLIDVTITYTNELKKTKILTNSKENLSSTRKMKISESENELELKKSPHLEHINSISIEQMKLNGSVSHQPKQNDTLNLSKYFSKYFNFKSLRIIFAIVLFVITIFLMFLTIFNDYDFFQHSIDYLIEHIQIQNPIDGRPL